MGEMFIYKYQDTVDLNYAFVVSDSETNARKAIMERTSIPILLVGTRHLSDFPKIDEDYSFKRVGDSFIFINNILPF